MLESSSSDPASRDKLKRQLSEFLVGQRQHIYTEEVKVYPLVQSVLTKDGWMRLHKMVPVLDKPIFGRWTREDFELLENV